MKWRLRIAVVLLWAGCSHQGEVALETAAVASTLEIPQLAGVNSDGASCCELSPDGRLLVVASNGRLYRNPDFVDPSRIIVIDAATSEILKQVEVRLPITRVVFSTDGKIAYVSTGATDPPLTGKPVTACRKCPMGQVLRFSMPSWDLIEAVTFLGPVLDVRFRDGHVFATGGLSDKDGFVARMNGRELMATRQMLEVPGIRYKLNFEDDQTLRLESFNPAFQYVDQYVHLQDEFTRSEMTISPPSSDGASAIVFGDDNKLVTFDNASVPKRNYTIRQSEQRGEVTLAIGGYAGLPSWLILSSKGDELLARHRTSCTWLRQIAIDFDRQRVYVVSGSQVDCVPIDIKF